VEAFMKKYLLPIVCTLTVSCASTPAFGGELPAPVAATAQVDEDILNALLKIAENVVIESARECKTQTTWHCQASPVIAEYARRKQDKQEKQKAADK
jgi:hypothetical protein